MFRFGTFIAAAAFALAAAANTAAADQDDPRLDRLFAVLQTSENSDELDLSQRLIWDIWNSHNDAAVSREMRRGMFAMTSGRFDDALHIFNGLIAVDPGYAEAWNKRATLYFMMGELDKSVADVERTLELEPRHFGALSGLGQIEMQRGDRKQALIAFEHALETNPHLAGARTMVERLRAKMTGREL